MYKEYQETKVASEEAKDKAAELASELDIVGGRAMAAAGDFEALNQEINNFNDAAAQDTIDAAENLLGGQYGNSLAGKEFGNGSAVQDFKDQ